MSEYKERIDNMSEAEAKEVLKNVLTTIGNWEPCFSTEYNPCPFGNNCNAVGGEACALRWLEKEWEAGQ